jgi:hypothetical protein
MDDLQELAELPALERSAALRIRDSRPAVYAVVKHSEEPIQIGCNAMPVDDVGSGSPADVEPFKQARVSVCVSTGQTYSRVGIQSGCLDSKSFKLVLKRERMFFCRARCSHKVWLQSIRPRHSLTHRFNLAIPRAFRCFRGKSRRV